MNELHGKLKTILLTSLIFLAFMAVPDARVYCALPNPAGSVLIIYTDDSCDNSGCTAGGYNPAGAAHIQSALAALSPAPAITMHQVACSLTSSSGIGMTATQLAAYCTVIDIRFLECPTVNPCTTTQSDVITAADSTAFLGFLAQGGHLYLAGDNSGFCPRDQSVLSFVTAATGCGIGYPNVDLVVPETFSTISTLLTGAYTSFAHLNLGDPGWIDSSQICGATPLISSGNKVVDMYWQTNQLTTGAGTLEVMFDTNAFSEADTVCCTTVPDSNYIQYMQDVYALNGLCFNLSVTKTASPVSVCLNAAVTFTVCATNTGTRTITNPQITDVIPSCLTFQSASPGGSMSGTTFIYNTTATLTTNQSTCVTIITKATSTNCP